MDADALVERISHLEDELAVARNVIFQHSQASDRRDAFPSHQLLLLADSALPLGSFAFSSGLESYLSHHPHVHNAQAQTLPLFLSLSLRSLASSTLPYLIAAFDRFSDLLELDCTLDACILCPVVKRASVAQGRALLTLWERALKHSCPASPASETLWKFSNYLRTTREEANEVEVPNAHFPLIWATVCRAMDMSLHDCAYTFLFNQAKAILSAGVRANIAGPYAAQRILGSTWLKGEIEDAVRSNWEVNIDDAAQSVPMLDLWVGRHELLYSRIFNS